MLHWQTRSEDETVAIGVQIAAILPRRGAVLLRGNLGAGKTTLAKGIALGLGAAQPEEVSSPTFTLVHEYGSPVRVYHVDLYRIETAGQAASLGLEELFDRDALVLIEWGEKFPGLLPAGRFEIYIERGADEVRTVRLLTSPGP